MDTVGKKSFCSVWYMLALGLAVTTTLATSPPSMYQTNLEGGTFHITSDCPNKLRQGNEVVTRNSGSISRQVEPDGDGQDDSTNKLTGYYSYVVANGTTYGFPTGNITTKTTGSGDDSITLYTDSYCQGFLSQAMDDKSSIAFVCELQGDSFCSIIMNQIE